MVGHSSLVSCPEHIVRRPASDSHGYDCSAPNRYFASLVFIYREAGHVGDSSFCLSLHKEG